jgi:hypothetical protein
MQKYSTISVASPVGLLKAPFRALVIGASGSGKTEFVKYVIEKNLIWHPEIVDYPKKIFWYFDKNLQPPIINLKEDVDPVVFQAGLPTFEDTDKFENTLVVIDDLFLKAFASEFIANLFTKFSRQKSISVILLAQNIFVRHPFALTIRRSSDYKFIFRPTTDTSDCRQISLRLTGRDSKFLESCFSKTSQASVYHCVLIDSKPETPDRCRIRRDFRYVHKFEEAEQERFIKRPKISTIILERHK